MRLQHSLQCYNYYTMYITTSVSPLFFVCIQNDVEILFQARDTRNDGDYCHEQAILMVANVKTVSDPGVFVLNEVTFVAALIVAPEAVVDAAPAFAASCAMLLGAFLVAFLL